MTRPGENLIRTKLAEIEVRMVQLDAAREASTIGPKTVRARYRWLREDFVKLTQLAEHYGFKTES